MGKFIKLEQGLFSQYNLGTITPQQTSPLVSLSITGEESIARGSTVSYYVTYNPVDTSETGVTWSIQGTPSGASISETGVLSVNASYVGDSIVIVATSSVHDTISATKTLSVTTVQTIDYTMDNLYTGNINSSKKTSAGSYFVHYESAIPLNGKTKVKITFPNVSSSYSSYKWNVKVVELNTIDGLPSNWLTTAAVTLTSYISVFPDYSKIDVTGNNDSFEYEITGENTVAVCIQWGMYSGSADIQCFSSSTYGKQVTTQNRKSWINELSTTEVLGRIDLL